MILFSYLADKIVIDVHPANPSIETSILLTCMNALDSFRSSDPPMYSQFTMYHFLKELDYAGIRTQKNSRNLMYYFEVLEKYEQVHGDIARLEYMQYDRDLLDDGPRECPFCLKTDSLLFGCWDHGNVVRTFFCSNPCCKERLEMTNAVINVKFMNQYSIENGLAVEPH